MKNTGKTSCSLIAGHLLTFFRCSVLAVLLMGSNAALAQELTDQEDGRLKVLFSKEEYEAIAVVVDGRPGGRQRAISAETSRILDKINFPSDLKQKLLAFGAERVSISQQIDALYAKGESEIDPVQEELRRAMDACAGSSEADCRARAVPFEQRIQQIAERTDQSVQALKTRNDQVKNSAWALAGPYLRSLISTKQVDQTEAP